MDFVTLLGADDVYRASTIMQNAASEMKQAVANLEGVLFTHQRFMEDWLQRFEIILEKQKPGGG